MTDSPKTVLAQFDELDHYDSLLQATLDAITTTLDDADITNPNFGRAAINQAISLTEVARMIREKADLEVDETRRLYREELASLQRQGRG